MVERVVVVHDAPPPPPKREEAPPPAPPEIEPPPPYRWPATPYARLEDKVLRWGLDGLAEPPAPPDAPPDTVDSLLNSLDIYARRFIQPTSRRCFMRNCLLCGALVLGSAVLASADPPVPPPEPAPVVTLTVKPGRPKDRALRYTLLPDPLDQTRGNAAPLWIRAGESASDIERSLHEGPNKVVAPVGTPLNPEGKKVPLKDLPKDEIRAYLAYFSTALRLADQAARCDHCDWELPPFTIQDFDFPLQDVQRLRTVAALLMTRSMLELSESRFDDANRTLQSGFALARDVGKGETLIQDLVGIAIAAIMFNQVEEWEQIPGSPNLFWALTDLPAPLVDVAPAMRSELNTLYRSFPPLHEALRDADKETLSEAETNRIVADLIKVWQTYVGQSLPDWQRESGAALLVLKTYPEAKKYLKDHGRSDEQVDAMPAAQVVLLYFVAQYGELRDDVLKWMNVATRGKPRVGLRGDVEANPQADRAGRQSDHCPAAAGRREGLRRPRPHRLDRRLPPLCRGHPLPRHDARWQAARKAGGPETAAAAGPVYRRGVRQVLPRRGGRHGRFQRPGAAEHAPAAGPPLRAGAGEVTPSRKGDKACPDTWRSPWRRRRWPRPPAPPNRNSTPRPPPAPSRRTSMSRPSPSCTSI